MKKIYESPESITVAIQMNEHTLQDPIHTSGPDHELDAREYNNSIWDDDASKGGKKIFDEEW